MRVNEGSQKLASILPEQLLNTKQQKKGNRMTKATFLMTVVQNGAKRIPMGLVVAGAIFLQHNAMANPAMVNLGTASSFAVLAGSEITDAGGASTITGNVGLSPTTGAAIGLTSGQVNGT